MKVIAGAMRWPWPRNRLPSPRSFSRHWRHFSLARRFSGCHLLTQATMRTASPPSQHGIIANGRFDRRARRVDFWQQSARLPRRTLGGSPTPSGRRHVVPPKSRRRRRLRHFPAPIHKHHGGMLQACQTKPPELEKQLNSAIDKRFNLSDYQDSRQPPFNAMDQPLL